MTVNCLMGVICGIYTNQVSKCLVDFEISCFGILVLPNGMMASEIRFVLSTKPQG